MIEGELLHGATDAGAVLPLVSSKKSTNIGNEGDLWGGKVEGFDLYGMILLMGLRKWRGHGVLKRNGMRKAHRYIMERTEL